MTIARRDALLGLGLGLGLGTGGTLLAPLPLRAQGAWPSQPIRVVVPFPPGGLTDVLGRLVAERLQSAFGQPAVVDNRPGAATQVGAALVAKQPADGYTLLIATSTTLGIVPALYAKPLIAVAEFAAVAMLGNVTFFLVARPDLAATTPPKLMAMLRDRPDTYSYGSPGAGTAHHLLVELIKTRENAKAQHVPYQGSTKAVVDLMESRLDFMFLDASVALPQIVAGKIKALAVTGKSRLPSQPDVPALTEFYDGLDLQAWQSIVGPAGLAVTTVEKINAEINKALGEPTFMQRLQEVGVEPTPLTVKAFGDLIQRDAGRWAELVRVSGARPD